jgi:flagellar basal body rod protein FlgG
MGNLYTGAMGMISFQNKLEVVGNNIANARTNGYKKEVETFKVFEESFHKILSNDRNQTLGSYQHQVHMDEIHTNMEQGTVNLTDRSYDFAIQDSNQDYTNFFAVQKNGEKFLTRDGSFQIDKDRYLSMNDGSYVLNEQGNKIQMPVNSKPALSREGTLTDVNTGLFIADLNIESVSKENKHLLEKAGNNKFKVITIEEFISNYGPLENILTEYDKNISLRKLFPNKETVEDIVASGNINILEKQNNYSLLAGALEQSNVDMSKEMTEMIIAQRGFQASAKALQAMDKINEKDANQIGI